MSEPKDEAVAVSTWGLRRKTPDRDPGRRLIFEVWIACPSCSGRFGLRPDVSPNGVVNEHVECPHCGAQHPALALGRWSRILQQIAEINADV